jgi:hypothetical protein
MVASRVRVRWDIGWEGWSKERTGTGLGGGIMSFQEFLERKTICFAGEGAVQYGVASDCSLKGLAPPVCREAFDLLVFWSFLVGYRVTLG